MTGSQKSCTIIGCFVLVFCWSNAIFGQVNTNIVEGPKVAELMNRFTELNKAKGTISGWRIQIIATTDFQKLESSRSTFKYRYPNIPVDWQDSKPFYQLRAGAFATKLEALRIKHILSRDYAGLYLVRDDIRPRELVNSY